MQTLSWWYTSTLPGARDAIQAKRNVSRVQCVAFMQAWPAAQLRLVDGAGHSAYEVPICAALVAATEETAARLHGASLFTDNA